MGKKDRIDVILVEKGFFESREKAKHALMSGIVYVENRLVDKAGTKVDIDSNIEIRGKKLPYVSRGGLKLEKALKEFKIDLKDKIAMDIGASTGGFTDCMLQHGAAKVYAVDVGYGQLDWKLRQDKRVINMERTNIRNVKLEDIGEMVDFISIDVAFISLTLVFPVVKEILKEGGEVVFLIKPQFEAGREKVGKKGVVKDKNVHKEVVKGILEFIIKDGFTIKGLTYSPIRGPEGNIEFLGYCLKGDSGEVIDVEKIADHTIEEAHHNL